MAHWLRRALLLLVATATGLSAQPSTRRVVNIASLLAHPAFFHTRPILIAGLVKTEANGQVRVSDEAGSVRVVVTGAAPEGRDEIRGEFWDVGRMKSDDPRLARLELHSTFGIDPDGPWPKPGEITAIVATTIQPDSAPSAASIRTVVLHPSQYLQQKVTLTGQYAGRNLYGDLPDAPAQSRYDFVLRAADAAVWIGNARPRVRIQGKDVDLSLDARIDTGRWLQVTGTVREARGLQWIDADVNGLSLASPLTQPADEEPIATLAVPPPEVIFSTPIDDENDVALGTKIRVQFSRDIDPATLKGRVRASYVSEQDAVVGEPVPAAPEITTRYTAATRVLELSFSKPLERFKVLKVELTDGILGTDRQPLKPWTLRFRLGGF